MKFVEPQVEFVEFENDDVVTSSTTASVETCNGPDAPMNTCGLTGSFLN